MLDVRPGGIETVGEEDVVVVLDVVVLVVVVVVVGGVGGRVLLVVVVVVVVLDGCPGWPGTPRQAPNWLWQPAPQNSIEAPHQKNCEQQGPKLGFPMHMVLLPHMPLVVTCNPPVGKAVEDVEVLVATPTGCVVTLLLVFGGTEVAVVGSVAADDAVEVGVVDVTVGGAAAVVLGHPQVPYWV